MTDLVLLDGLPGGPYRLSLVEAFGRVWFEAAEMCTCPVGGGGPHWHTVTPAAPSLAGLVADLLAVHIEGVSR